jgi:hypothetical protein
MNVHDAVYFYVHRSVSPATAIQVIQPAALFDVEGWPPFALDWAVGLRWGSMRKLEVTEESGGALNISLKNIIEVEVEDIGDEGEEVVATPVKVNLQQVRKSGDGPVEAAVAVREAPSVPEVQEEPAPVVSASANGSEPRTVVVEVDRMPDQEAFKRFVELAAVNGLNTVMLRTPEGELLVSESSALSPAQSGTVSMVLGGARVTYAPESVDPGVLTEGMVF